MRIQQRFRKSDFLWLLAFPLYEVLGTIRHEASHALVARVEWAKIEQFVVWPSTVGGQHFWGYVIAQNVSYTLQWELKDSTGTSCHQDTAFGKEPDGMVAVGGVIRGTIAYEVPQSIHSFVLHVGLRNVVVWVDDAQAEESVK